MFVALFPILLLLGSTSFAQPQVLGPSAFSNSLEDLKCLNHGLISWNLRGDGEARQLAVESPEKFELPGFAGYRLEYQRLLPERAAAINLKEQAFGVNCWNTALFANHVMEQKPIQSYEFQEVLRSSCIEKAVDAPLLAGDIVSFLSFDDTTPMHAWVYVSPEFGFHKEGSRIEYLPTLVTTRDLFRDHFWLIGLTPEQNPELDPARCISKEGVIEEPCRRALQVFSCDGSG